MFDAARTIALVWVLIVAYRARMWGAVVAALAVAYFLALEVASGITVRDQGPMMPAVSLVLAFIGPSVLPRGPLPSVLFARAAVEWPATVDGITCLALAVVSWRASRRVTELPACEEHLIRRGSSVVLALMLSAVFQGLVFAMRLLPVLLGGQLGNGAD